MTDQTPPTAPETVVLDGRTFVGVSNAADGDVGADTVFAYRQEGDLVWAEYAGGSVRKGFLVGTRTGDALNFRYSHLDSAGETAGGACTSRIEVLGDGRVRLHETWAWESRPGTGRSVVEERGSRP
ncbi:hypothetical protein [Kocuria nitroreducens]|uniref:hypothetical protein n=1 Tax=Kocuria nitroreducens TaxID=3058914 RepID=UPI0036DC9F60